MGCTGQTLWNWMRLSRLKWPQAFITDVHPTPPVKRHKISVPLCIGIKRVISTRYRHRSEMPRKAHLVEMRFEFGQIFWLSGFFFRIAHSSNEYPLWAAKVPVKTRLRARFCFLHTQKHTQQNWANLSVFRPAAALQSVMTDRGPFRQTKSRIELFKPGEGLQIRPV